MPKQQQAVGEDVDALVGVCGGESRSAPFSGTRALMLAVLEDAIRALLGTDKRAREEADHWIFSVQVRSVFSFEVVCEILGLEPKAVRVALRQLSAQGTPAALLARSRPNAKGSGMTLSTERSDLDEPGPTEDSSRRPL